MITYDRLKLIIPADQALACKALQVSLQQIKGISEIPLENLAGAFLAIETTDNLSNINALTSPVPESTANFYANNYATGSGPNGTLYLTDVIGFPVGGTGNVYTEAVSNVFNTMNVMSTAGAFDNLINVYTIMQDVNSGVYGDPVNGPIANVPLDIANSFSNATVCYADLLLPAANANIISIVSSNPTQVTSLNSKFNYLADSVILEIDTLLDAGLDLFQTDPSGRIGVTSFVQSLPDYGKDQSENGPAWYLEQVTDTSTLSGQSVIGVMREGRNADILSNFGIGQDTAVSDLPETPPPQANLIPSVQTESQARANIVY